MGQDAIVKLKKSYSPSCIQDDDGDGGGVDCSDVRDQ